MSAKSPRALRVLFVVAAGPRIGFGHLIRARSLARALGVTARLVLRGTPATERRAEALGCTLSRDEGRVDVIVVDDPVRGHVDAWVRRARQRDVPIATVHDLGISATVSDLVIDGTVAPRASVRGRAATLHGPAYMILDPAIRRIRDRGVAPVSDRVLVALGGGGSAARAVEIAHAIRAAVPHADVRVAGGFTGRRRGPDGLAGELADASVAVVAGGVTLYEACALGVPTVAVPVTVNQRVTVRAVGRAGAAVAVEQLASAANRKITERTIAAAVARLLDDGSARRRLSAAGRRLVDGRGAFRVAAALHHLVRSYRAA